MNIPRQLPLNVFFCWNLQGWAMSIRWVLNLTSRLNKHWFENRILGPATQLPEIMPSTHSRYNFNSITIIHPFWWLFFYLRSLSVTLLPESTSTCVASSKRGGSLLCGWKFTLSHLPISTLQVSNIYLPRRQQIGLHESRQHSIVESSQALRRGQRRSHITTDRCLSNKT